jgi:hypothetical protein
VGGDHEIVSLTCGEAGDSGGGGIAGIEGLGVSAAGGTVIDVIADDGGVSISVPGQGDALSGLGHLARDKGVCARNIDESSSVNRLGQLGDIP